MFKRKDFLIFESPEIQLIITGVFSQFCITKNETKKDFENKKIKVAVSKTIDDTFFYDIESYKKYIENNYSKLPAKEKKKALDEYNKAIKNAVELYSLTNGEGEIIGEIDTGSVSENVVNLKHMAVYDSHDWKPFPKENEIPDYYFVVRSPYAQLLLTGVKKIEFRSNAKMFANKRLAIAVAKSTGTIEDFENEVKVWKPTFENTPLLSKKRHKRIC